MNKQKSEERFNYKGYNCIIRKRGLLSESESFNNLKNSGIESSWYCGYVEILKNHKLFGIDYNDENVEILEVHGGITYSRCEDNNWVIGFDCMHCGDSIIIQNENYVKEEIKHLVEQLIEMDKKQ